MKLHFNRKYSNIRLSISVLFSVLFLSSFFLSDGSDVNSAESYVTIPDLAQLSGQKYLLTVDDNTYTIFYGMSPIDETDTSGSIQSISVVPENYSLLIQLDSVLQTEVLWIRFPNEVISAENNEFTLFIDGEEKGYELSSHGDETRLSFLIYNNAKKIEIVGNNVIPEFPTALLTLSM